MQPWSSDHDHLHWLSELGISSFKGLGLLDVGCGSGYVCHHAMEQGASHAVGIDIVKPKGLGSEAAWTFMDSDLNAADWTKDLKSKKFDLILAFDILEHLDSPYVFLKNVRSLMTPQARLVLTTPNLMSWERFAKPGTWSGVRDVQHKTLFTRYSLRFILSKADLQVAMIKAPLRSLGGLSPLTPQIGGQIVCVATPQ